MLRRTKETCFLILLILLTTLLSGCWSNKDITNRGFVAAIGIDKAKNSSIEVTLQIVKPNVLRSGQNGGGSSEDAFWVHSSKGNTVFEAIRNQLKTYSRKPYYSHMLIMIIGEELAREGITDILDLFERDPELRLTFLVLIAKGSTAKSVLELRSDVEDIPAVHLKEILENNDSLGKAVKIQLFDILKKITFTGYDSAIGTIQSKNTQSNMIKDVEITGAAILEGDKLIGWLTPSETRGLNYALNEVKDTIINVANPLDKKKTVTIEQIDSKGKMDVEFRNNKLILKVDIDALGNLGSQDGKGNLVKEEMLSVLESEAERIIKTEILSTMSEAQDNLHADFFGFCKIVHRKYPDYWKVIKYNWQEVFSKAEVEIKVNFVIGRTGTIFENIQAK